MSLNIRKIIPADALSGLGKNAKAGTVRGYSAFFPALPLSLSIAIALGVLPARGFLRVISAGFNIIINNKSTKFLNHSVIEGLYHFKHKYVVNGGILNSIGLKVSKPVLAYEFVAGKR